MQEQNLQKQTISSLIWKLFERFGAQLIQFVVNIVLARILMPEDYGAIALLTVFIAVSNVFTQTGFSSALIRKLDADELDYSSVFWSSFAISIVIYIILFFTAPLIADLYELPILTDVLRVLSLVVIVGTYNSVQNAILSKKLLFKKLFISSFSSVLLSGVIGIGCAYAGLGVWSLAAQQLSAVVITTIVMSFTVKWHPTFKYSFKRVKSLLSFGWKLLLSGLLDTIYNNIYSLVIGKKYSAEDLAYWNRGKQFPDIIVNNINGSIQSVMFPVYSMKQNKLDELKQMVRRSIKISGYLVFPMMVGLAVVAEPLVKLLLTDKWLFCVPFLQAWCIIYAFMPIHTTNLQVYNALGRSDIFLGLEIVKKIIGIIVLVVTLPYGLTVMICAKIGQTVLCSFINALPNTKVLRYSIKEQIVDLLPMMLLSAAMGGIVYAASLIPVHYVAKLVIEVIVGIVSYLLLSVIFKPEAYTYCLGMVKKVINNIKDRKHGNNDNNTPKEDNNKQINEEAVITAQQDSKEDNQMKKILLLGGSTQQIVAIEKAKELGYYTVLCDYLPDNPGQNYADKFYLASTTDKDLILNIATKEKIDGIIAYASDPAAPTAAYVAEKLNLPTNPYWSVDMFSNKNIFREFLAKHNFDVPSSFNAGLEDYESKINLIDNLEFPIMVKPVDSSGSKGITKINSKDEYIDACKYAFSFSRCKTIQVEEFIEKDHPYLIGGDIIVNNGKIEIFGTMNCHRNNKVNPLVPIGKSYPCTLSDSRTEKMINELQRLITEADIKFGAFNIELVFDKKDRMFIIDMGARSGGNMIPELMSYIFDEDIVALLVKMAMGENVVINVKSPKQNVCSYNLASQKSGILKEIVFDENIKKHIFMQDIYKKQGDDIEFFDYSAKLLGIVFLQFDTNEEVESFYENLDNNIQILIK